MVHGVGVHADVGARRQALGVDADAAGADFAPEGAADGRGHAERLVDAGAEVAAGGELGGRADGGRGGEGGADLGGEFGEAGWVGGEVEEEGREAGGGGVGAWFVFSCCESEVVSGAGLCSERGPRAAGKMDIPAMRRNLLSAQSSLSVKPRPVSGSRASMRKEKRSFWESLSAESRSLTSRAISCRYFSRIPMSFLYSSLSSCRYCSRGYWT